jgi:serine protease Do
VFRFHALVYRVVLGLVVCASASACGGASSGGATAPDGARRVLRPAEIVQRSKPAIVRIEVRAPQAQGIGTGFVLTADGRVATNLHVIGGATEIDVILHDGTRLPVHEIAATDPSRDLAVLAVTPTRPLIALPLGNSDELQAGDPVLAISNPLGVLDHTVSDGLISSIRQVSPELTVLQISAPISQGSSGGPLFNQYGEVIGVATFISGTGQNLNFGIPSNYLRPLLARNDHITPQALAEAIQREYSAAQRRAQEQAQRSGRARRPVPQHDLSILDGCSQDALDQAIAEIAQAVQAGVPLYNDGNHEACFRIYEGTAIRLERELACPGLRDALGQGLLRAGTLDDYSARAWALRDAFDGVLDVIQRKADAGAGQPAEPAGKPAEPAGQPAKPGGGKPPGKPAGKPAGGKSGGSA